MRHLGHRKLLGPRFGLPDTVFLALQRYFLGFRPLLSVSRRRGPYDRAGIEAVDTHGSFFESGITRLALSAFQHTFILTLLPAYYQYAEKYGYK